MIDINFKSWSDTPEGKDPDRHSPTLRRYHKILWSKPLPCGTMFTLHDDIPEVLCHRSDLGEFVLSSDAIGNTYSWNVKRTAHIIEQIPKDEIERFRSVCNTIGAYILFPAMKVGKKGTMNQDRGWNPSIVDRFDLTLECIRRFYADEASPLSDTIHRYASFFRLFEDFKGYTDFFLLQDLVAKDYSSVKHFLPFDGFGGYPLPKDVEEYRLYKNGMTAFVKARNQRMLDSVDSSKGRRAKVEAETTPPRSIAMRPPISKNTHSVAAKPPQGKNEYVELTSSQWEQVIAQSKGNPTSMFVLRSFAGSQKATCGSVVAFRGKVMWEPRDRKIGSAAIAPLTRCVRNVTGNQEADFYFWVKEEGAWVIGWYQHQNLRKALKAAENA